MKNLINFKKELLKYRIKRAAKESIEPEEILLDATKASELEEQKLEVPIRANIFKYFLILVAIGFLVLAGRAGYMQVVSKSYYLQLAEQNRTRSFPIFAARGIIYDRVGQQLVYNVPNFDLMITPQDLPLDKLERLAVIEKTAELLDMTAEQIFEQLRKFNPQNTQSLLLVSGLEHEKALMLESELAGLSAFGLEKNAVRQYIMPFYLSHILGYVGRLDRNNIKANPDYFLTEKIGKDGIELSYEKILRGKPGEMLYEFDALGRQKRLVSETQPIDGAGLILTIDSELQRRIYDSLSEALARFKLKKAAAVALNPQSGGVLALVSFPGFDNNLFAPGAPAEKLNEILADSAQPLFNRAVGGQYAPGSTIKPMIGAAALEEKTVTKFTKIVGTSEITVVNQYNPNIVYRFKDWKAHGVVDIYSAIADSCNVYFYTIGGGYGNIEGLGIERLEKYLKLFGFGEKLGIDLAGEAAGLVPNADWKKDAKGEAWYTGDTYHLSIGQGNLLVTPLQLAAATASIFNGGKILQPYLVDKIIDSDKNIIKTIKPKTLDENFISQQHLDTIKQGMRQAVTSGSALLFNNLAVAAAAKTGTAQVAGQENTNAWISVVAPLENPEIVLVVLVENAGEGSIVAAPIARDVLNYYFSNK